jgi:hypothetical protein
MPPIPNRGLRFWLLENDESTSFFRSSFSGMMFDLAENAESDEQLKMVQKLYPADKPAPIEPDWISQSRQALNMGDMFPKAGRPRMGESMTDTIWLNSQPARILREPGETSRKAMAP